jgi:transposase
VQSHLCFNKYSLNKDEQIKDLLAQVELLTRQVSALLKENAELRERLARYENPKNSRNSSVPPSKDENRPFKSKSLREKSGKRPGGQAGRKGSTLEMTENPDHRINHMPCYCGKCGSDLSGVPYDLSGKRQIIDLPPIKPVFTEHRIYQTQCACGHTTSGTYPAAAIAAVNYGPGVESLVGYFHSRQYLPFLRMKELFNDVLGIPISEGGLHCMVKRLTEKAIPIYEHLRTRIIESSVVGTDETGAKVDGKKSWMWAWQNAKTTFIAASPNRGYATIEKNFPNGFPKSIIVSDCWKSHFQPIAAGHQLCMAHLLRELNYLQERYQSAWAKKCKVLFMRAMALKKQMNAEDYLNHQPPRSLIETHMDQLLSMPTNDKHKEVTTFKKRMIKYRSYLFTFLHHQQVPPDNNGSERAIRNIKVKQKISGQFKSKNAAQRFAILRSITDTAIKNGQNVLNSLLCVAMLERTD